MRVAAARSTRRCRSFSQAPSGLQDEGAPFPLDAIGEIVYAISQTPQVWLDHQLYERNGELELSWDSVEELFPPGLLAAMFETYTDLIHRLATNDQAFQDHAPVALPDSHADIVLDANAAPRPNTRPAAKASRERGAVHAGEAANHLARLVASALGRESVDPYASFDQLGATSLDVIRLQPRINQQLGVELALRDILECTSLADLAEKATPVAR